MTDQEIIIISENAKQLSEYVTLTSMSTAIVQSQSEDKIYHVNMEEKTCECPDNYHRGNFCKHLQATQYKLMPRTNFNDPEDCDHDSLDKIGDMESGKLDGVYIIPFHCIDCNYFIVESYDYNGMEVLS